MKGDVRCIEGRLWRHDPQNDDPELETQVGECPDCSGKGCDDAEPVTFINGLGNRIKLEVRRQDGGLVWVSMEGPSSATELEMTAMEAEMLHRQLGDLLK